MKHAPPSPRHRPLFLGVGTAAGLAALAAPAAFSGPSAPAKPVAPAASAKAPDFNQEVRPILARHCFKCHGPDDKQRQAGLRLDTREAALRVILPGKPDASGLIRRVCAPNVAAQMPPPNANLPLSEAQKDVLRRWVAAGARYEPHWAFVAPKAGPLPAVKLKSWPKNPIDYFVLARLEKEGLQPSPPADKYTLVRRVYLDLIGLPPTPEEADVFVNDRDPSAYEKLVDRLLASPHYGERWARKWLDLARYADTNGYEKDRPRTVWPYRDYVIHSLNADKPFNQFTVEQLAGDMLPNATPEQRIATGFHRNTMLNEEGGIDPLEFRYNAMTDRVATTATTWLGLTLGCAQCHTHKFDPIPHREYYQFMAFMNNTEEPEFPVPQPEIEARRAEIRKQVAAREAELPSKFPSEGALTGRANLDRKFNAWLESEATQAVKWTVLRPTEVKTNLPLLKQMEDGSLLATGDMTKRDVYNLTFKPELKGITALRLEALPDDSLPRRGPGRVFYEGGNGDFFLSEMTATADGQPVKWGKASQTSGTNAQQAVDGTNQTGWSINGGQGRAHSAVFPFAQPLDRAGELRLQMTFERYYASALGRFRISVTTDSRPVSARLPATVEDALATPAAQRTAAQRELLFQHYLSIAPELAKERDEIAKLRASEPQAPMTLVMRERPAFNPRATHVHNRGEYLSPREVVQPGTLSILPPLPKDAPKNRLTFARWLVDPKNPLVGRVTVNRQWAALFGQGIVRSTADFGYQGDPPTHPELLDWLAANFVAGVGPSTSGVRGAAPNAQRPMPNSLGWSLKRLHRLIVTSATYQQSSRVSPELARRDPQNVLLARGPRQRLEAELLRDAALRESGLLSEKLGGPSVFPPQPASVTTEGTYGGLQWKVSEGEDRYRRGLYTFSKRTAPFAMFLTFDGPTGEACLARREVSNTPLQALTLLNDSMLVETAQALGKMVATRPGTPEERAAYLFRRILTRPPSAAELAQLLRFYSGQKARLEKGELKAAEVAGKGDGDVNERAAWTLLARSLQNLDEAIVKR